MKTLSIIYRGRLGNQLFELAAGLFFSKASGRTLVWRPNELQTREPYEFIVYYPHKCELRSQLEIEEKGPLSLEDYVKLCRESSQDHISLKGYFQSPKIVEGNESLLLELLEKHKEADYEDYIDAMGIHVRRGDYLHDVFKVFNVDFHIACPTGYYAQALKLCKSPRKIVYSDDIDWCKTQVVFSDCEFADLKPIQTLLSLSKCKEIVMANSSFSLLASLLSNAREIYSPCSWFTCFIPKPYHHNCARFSVLGMCLACKNSHHPSRCTCKKRQ